MQKPAYLFPILFSLLFAYSCSGFLDNVSPTDNLALSDIYKSANDLETALNGVYNVLQSNGLAGSSLLLIPELMGGNATFTTGGFPEPLSLSNLELRSDNLESEEFWIAAYKAVNLINAILSAAENMPDPALTPARKARIEGEALFIRGFLYFELTRYFGQPYGDATPQGGVPILTEPAFQKGDVTFPARSSVLQGYDRARADLEKARELLPESLGFGRANPRAASALLARMAFQRGDYALAGAIAKDLIERPDLALTATPQEVFLNETNSEIIWAVRYSSADPNGFKVFWFGQTRGLSPVSAELKDAFDNILTAAQKQALQLADLEAIDGRSTPGALLSPNGLFTNKYENVGAGIDDTPMARLAEFYLMRAEVLARENDLEGATNLLNQVRARSIRVFDSEGKETPAMQHLVLFSPSDFPGGAEELIEQIILERRVELCFEGHFFQDMIRLRRPVQGVSYDDCRLRLPSPQRDMDANPNLTQNEPCY